MHPRVSRVIVKHCEQACRFNYKNCYHLIAEKYNVAFSSCIFKIHGAGVENQLLNVRFPTWSHKNSYLGALFSETVFMYILLHILLQFQREMSTEWL